MEGQARNRSVIDAIDRLINWIAGGLVGLGVLLMTYQIAVRFLFGKSYDWGIEVLVGLVLAGLMIAGISIVRTDGHTNLSIVTDRLKGRTLVAWELILSFVSFLTFTMLCVSGIIFVYHVMISGAVTSSSLAMPHWIYYLPLPIAMGGCALLFIEKMVLKLRALRQNHPSKEL